MAGSAVYSADDPDRWSRELRARAEAAARGLTAVPSMQSTYVRAADLFRQVLQRAARRRPRPPGAVVPGLDGLRRRDPRPRQPRAGARPGARRRRRRHGGLRAGHPRRPRPGPPARRSTPLDLTLHAWDVALACGVELRLGDDQLAFLEAFAAEAGDRLYLEEGFARPEGERADPDGLDRQGRALLPFGRRA